MKEIKLEVWNNGYIGDFILKADRLPNNIHLIDHDMDMFAYTLKDASPILTNLWLRTNKCTLRRSSKSAKQLLDKWGKKIITEEYPRCPCCKQEIIE